MHVIATILVLKFLIFHPSFIEVLLSIIYVVVIMCYYQMNYHCDSLYVDIKWLKYGFSIIHARFFDITYIKKIIFWYGYKTIDYMILIRLYIEYDCQSICCLLTVNIMLQQFYYCNYLDRLSRPLLLLPWVY